MNNLIETNSLDASELQDKEVTQDVLGENGTTNHHYMVDRKPSTRKVMIVSTTNDDAHMFEAKDDVCENLIETNSLDASELQDKEVTQDAREENGATNHHYVMDRKPSKGKVMIVSTTNDDTHMFESNQDEERDEEDNPQLPRKNGSDRDDSTVKAFKNTITTLPNDTTLDTRTVDNALLRLYS